MKAFITGIAGFAGSYLASHLIRQGFEVSGTVRHSTRLDNLKPILHHIQLYACDLLDRETVFNTIRDAKPDYIYHLAADSNVTASWDHSLDTLYNNIACQAHLLDAIRICHPGCRILIAGSSEQYGYVKPEELPIKETNPFRPLNPYAVSKISQEHLAYQNYKTYGLHTVIVRTFHHTGPGRSDNVVTSSFAKQIAEIEKGLKPPILHVGNLSAVRDFLDVRDVVRAYKLALDCCEPGEAYNIASGHALSVNEMLTMLLSFSQASIEIQVDPLRLRPSDSAAVYAGYEKFHARTGWKPEIPLEQTLLDLLNSWRAKLS
ncbi:GDP-mannose 4,6-dehydratase [Paenibacillus protaetiae]|uniref:SDR family oxidoreductase n=1 Tax=Paenibacillus protaetiae TaxID=2509456 RepID=A0A4P6ERM2_9BACL|nr:GDP-mannose 4,6-dehydratase [Paenibacillus protaetiae]QAY65552.1 SDR family oxidoreductase [Paenibacillus protaetiae]